MSLLGRLFGEKHEPGNGTQHRLESPNSVPLSVDQIPEHRTNEQALERYRYLLRTAPPGAIEQTHAEAFAQLTADQRRAVLEGLSSDLTPEERAASDDPQSLARIATRAELRRPGTIERAIDHNSIRGGLGAGAFATGNLLNTIAAVVIGSAIADAIFDDGGYDRGFEDGSEAAGSDQGATAADNGFDDGALGDSGDGFFGSGDFTGGEF